MELKELYITPDVEILSFKSAVAVADLESTEYENGGIGWGEGEGSDEDGDG